MNIKKCKNGKVLEVIIDGQIDTLTAPDVEREIKESIEGVTELRWDFSKVEYVSSAGLRVLLIFQKLMNKSGSMMIKHVNDEVMEVMKMTGFLNILVIEA